MHQLGIPVVVVKISHGGGGYQVQRSALHASSSVKPLLTKQLSKVHPYRKVSCIENTLPGQISLPFTP